MKLKERSEKAGLKLNIRKTKIMAFGPITSWQVDRETNFIFLGSKITVDSDCSLESKGHLLHGKKAMTNLDSILKSRDILYWCFSFWLTSLCIIGSSFIHLIRTDSNVFFLMSRFNARYWMLGAGMTQGDGTGREEGSGWGTHVYLWRIYVDI